MKGEMQRLTKQYDASMTMTAAIESYDRNPSRRVTFEDDARFVILKRDHQGSMSGLDPMTNAVRWLDHLGGR